MVGEGVGPFKPHYAAWGYTFFVAPHRRVPPLNPKLKHEPPYPDSPDIDTDADADPIDEHREFFEELAEHDDLRISKYARMLIDTDDDAEGGP